MRFNIPENLTEAISNQKTSNRAASAKYDGPLPPEARYNWRTVVFHLAESRQGQPMLKLRAEVENGPYESFRANKQTLLPLDQRSSAFPYQVEAVNEMLNGMTNGRVDAAGFIEALSVDAVATSKDKFGQNVIVAIGDVHLDRSQSFAADYSVNSQGYSDFSRIEAQ